MYHFIINPVSRSGRGQKIWKECIEPALQKENVPYLPHFSDKAGDAIGISRGLTEAATGIVTLVILGGDGTINEVLQGIADFSKVVIGYIPTGSSNDLARDLKISKNPLEALHTVLHGGSVQAMDLGKVTYPDGKTRRFAVSCGIGFDAAVCEEAMHSRLKAVLNKVGLGKLTYLGIALKQLITAKKASCELKLDDQEPIHIQKIFFIACMVHQYEGGGFKFCPEADYKDGILNLCVVGDISKPIILLALPTAFKGNHYKVKGITPYQASRIHIKVSAPLWVHTDGEVEQSATELTVTCDRGVLSMIL